MRTKLTTLITACCLGAIALSMDATVAAQDKAQCPAAAKAAAAKVVQAASSECQTSKKAVAVAASSCSGEKAEAVQLVSLTPVEEAGCSKQKTAQLLITALEKMDGCCGEKCPGRENVALAVRTMADATPGLVCETKLASLTKASSCGSGAKTAVLASNNAQGAVLGTCGNTETAPAKVVTASTCSGEKATGTVAATKVASGTNGACCAAPSRATAATLVSLNTEASQCSSKKANFVAYGCEKTDRVARAAARSYLTMMKELQAMSGAEGCSASAASELLASVLEEMRAEQQAAAVTLEDAPANLSIVTEPAVTCSGSKAASACCSEKAVTKK